MKIKTLRITLLATALTLMASRSSLAHAFLDHADPKVGSEVHQPPSQVRIWFTQNLEPAFSRITVSDRHDQEIDEKNCHVDGSEKNLLIVSLPPLPPGTYKVSWHVVSVDTHRTQGDFKFTVSP